MAHFSPLQFAGEIRYSGNLSRVKTFANFAVSGQFEKVLTVKIFMEYIRRRHYQWACHYSRQRRRFPLTCKAVFVQQQLPKPPRRHGSLDQRSPLRSSLAYSSYSCQFNLVRRFLPTHDCRFLTITRERLLLYGSRKFHPGENFTLAKISRY